MRQAYRILIMALILMSSGCALTHEYYWTEMPVPSEWLAKEVIINDGEEINIIRGRSDDERIKIGTRGAHQYFGTMQRITDAIADQLSIELQKRDVQIMPAGKKSIEIAVSDIQFKSNLLTLCTTLYIKVKLGNDKDKLFQVHSCTPMTVYRLYDGAVQVAVMEILKEPEVLAYINS